MGSINIRLTDEQTKEFFQPGRDGHNKRKTRVDFLEEMNLPLDAKIEILEYTVSNPSNPAPTEGPLIRITHDDIKANQ